MPSAFADQARAGSNFAPAISRGSSPGRPSISSSKLSSSSSSFRKGTSASSSSSSSSSAKSTPRSSAGATPASPARGLRRSPAARARPRPPRGSPRPRPRSRPARRPAWRAPLRRPRNPAGRARPHAAGLQRLFRVELSARTLGNSRTPAQIVELALAVRADLFGAQFGIGQSGDLPQASVAKAAAPLPREGAAVKSNPPRLPRCRRLRSRHDARPADRRARRAPCGVAFARRATNRSPTAPDPGRARQGLTEDRGPARRRGRPAHRRGHARVRRRVERLGEGAWRVEGGAASPSPGRARLWQRRHRRAADHGRCGRLRPGRHLHRRRLAAPPADGPGAGAAVEDGRA